MSFRAAARSTLASASARSLWTPEEPPPQGPGDRLGQLAAGAAPSSSSGARAVRRRGLAGDRRGLAGIAEVEEAVGDLGQEGDLPVVAPGLPGHDGGRGRAGRGGGRGSTRRPSIEDREQGFGRRLRVADRFEVLDRLARGRLRAGPAPGSRGSPGRRRGPGSRSSRRPGRGRPGPSLAGPASDPRRVGTRPEGLPRRREQVAGDRPFLGPGDRRGGRLQGGRRRLVGPRSRRSRRPCRTDRPSGRSSDIPPCGRRGTPGSPGRRGP